MKQGFNFLKPQVEPPSVWSKVYEWVIGTARIILIMAEVCVIIALAIRIFVDIQAKQLDNQISNLQAIMKVREPEETKYRTLQAHVDGFATAWTNTVLYNKVMNELNKQLPPSATGLQITINKNAINITGSALNAELDVMENNLKNSTVFTKTTLSRLETGSQTTTLTKGYAKFAFDTVITNMELRTLPTP